MPPVRASLSRTARWMAAARSGSPTPSRNASPTTAGVKRDRATGTGRGDEQRAGKAEDQLTAGAGRWNPRGERRAGGFRRGDHRDQHRELRRGASARRLREKRARRGGAAQKRHRE